MNFRLIADLGYQAEIQYKYNTPIVCIKRLAYLFADIYG